MISRIETRLLPFTHLRYENGCVCLVCLNILRKKELDVARIILWASTWRLSPQTMVTPAKSMSPLSWLKAMFTFAWKSCHWSTNFSLLRSICSYFVSWMPKITLMPICPIHEESETVWCIKSAYTNYLVFCLLIFLCYQFETKKVCFF